MYMHVCTYMIHAHTMSALTRLIDAVACPVAVALSTHGGGDVDVDRLLSFGAGATRSCLCMYVCMSIHDFLYYDVFLGVGAIRGCLCMYVRMCIVF